MQLPEARARFVTMLENVSRFALFVPTMWQFRFLDRVHLVESDEIVTVVLLSAAAGWPIM